jgi:tetratricopeptide (TPR) repeat protein
MKFVTYLILLLLVFNGLSFGQERFLMDQNTFQKFKQAKRMYVKGEQLYLKEKLAKAEEALEKCVEVFPKYSEAYFILSQVNYKQKEFPIALDYLLSAKAHFKYMSNLRVSTQMEYITTLQERSQKLKEVMRELQEKLSRTTNDAARSRLESALGLTKGQLSQIENRLHSPIPNIENLPAEYYYVHGNILLKMKKFQEAHKQYLEAVKVDPKHGNALNNISTLYFMAKKFDKAKEYLDRAEANGIVINEKYRKALLKALEN